jgi:hypothetical protein
MTADTQTTIISILLQATELSLKESKVVITLAPQDVKDGQWLLRELNTERLARRDEEKA